MTRKMSAANAAPPFGSKFLFWGLLTLSLLPWFFTRVQQVTNSDVLWLCEALHRIFAGLSLTQAAYEPNPPLNMFLYTLPVLAQSALHVPLHYAVFAQTLIVIGLSAGAIYAMLTRWQVFQNGFVDILTAAFILANTYGVSTYFSERDHYIALGLVPFVLLQLSITYNLPVPRYLKFPVLALGTILILVKPHHGLIPAMFILHRAFRRKSFSSLKDADFLALAAGSFLYATAIFLFFPDYISTILPEVVRLYLPIGDWNRVAVTILTGIISSIILLLGLLYTPEKNTRNERSFIFLLIACGLLSLIPYYVQKFGLYYHLIPALSFFAMAFACTLFTWFRTALPKCNSTIVCLVIIAALFFVHNPLNPGYPTHDNYKDLKLAKLLARECPHDRQCRFFMTNLNMGMMHEAAYYSGAHFASRFPMFWFQIKANRKDAEKYSALVTQDLIRDTPDILILVHRKDHPEQDFIPYYSFNKDFVRAMAHYKKTGTLRMSYDEFYRDTGASTDMIEYDIYKRNPS